MPRKLPDTASGLFDEELTGQVIKSFYFTYNVLGFGFLESVYRKALALELRARGLHVEEEKTIVVYYRDVVIGTFRVDLFVEHRLVVELKATAVLGPTDKRQLLNCLKASSMDLGLLLHYGVKPEFHRIAHPRIVSRSNPAVSERSGKSDNA